MVETPEASNQKVDETPAVSAEPEKAAVESEGETHEPDVIRARAERLTGPNVIGKIQLPDAAPKRNPVASSSNTGSADQKRKRKRKDNPPPGNIQQGGAQPGQQSGGYQG